MIFVVRSCQNCLGCKWQRSNSKLIIHKGAFIGFTSFEGKSWAIGPQDSGSFLASPPISSSPLYPFLSSPSEKAMVPHSSTLAWKIPWMEEPGRLQSMRSLRVRHDWATSLSFFTFMHWRRKWQPTPVFLPGESQGRWSLVGCRLSGCTESDTTEWLSSSSSSPSLPGPSHSFSASLSI